jgi:diguanylate cyclase
MVACPRQGTGYPTMLVSELLLALVHSIGLLALMAIAFGAVERQDWPKLPRATVQGFIFGFGAIIAMMSPAHIGVGVMVDARGLIVGFAAAFGGWPAALIAVAISGAYRLWLGGIGAAPGAAGILVAALLGLFWRYVLRPKTRIRAAHLAMLGVVVSSYVFTSFVMGFASFERLATMILPYMVATSVTASVLLGLFVDRELNQIAREQHWKTRALTDPLTALPNRRAFERGMAGLRPHDMSAGLLIADLDHFKVVNDTFGHAAGDYVLQQVALTMRAMIRDHDLLARLGGEELAVLLPDTEARRALEVAERLRAAIEAMDIRWEEQSIRITASFGLSVAPGTLPAEDMFVQADAALYAAKSAGRNRVVLSGEMLLRPAMGIGSVQVPPRTNRHSGFRFGLMSDS